MSTRDEVDLVQAEDARQSRAYRWYVLAVLTASQTCHALDRSIISIVMEPLKREFSLTDSQLGLVAGLIYGFAFAIAAVPFGLLVDRVNRRNLLATVVTVWSVLTAVCGLVQSYGALLTARMAVAAAEAGGTPTSMSLLSDYFGRKQRATAMGIWYTSAGIGVTITFLFGGYVAQHYGWRSAFFVAGIPGVIVAGVILLTVREPKRGVLDPVAAPEKAPAPRQVIAYVRSRSTILHLATGMVLCSMVASAASAWLVSFLAREHHLLPSQSGAISAIALGLFGAVGGLIAGVVADKFAQGKDGKARPHRLALVAMTTSLLSPIAGALSLQVSAAPLALGLLFTFAFFNNAYNSSANGLLLTSLEPRMRGLVISGYQVLANLVGYGVGPFLVGLLSDAIGGPKSLSSALMIVLMINFWAALHFWLASLSAQRELARAIAVGQPV